MSDVPAAHGRGPLDADPKRTVAGRLREHADKAGSELYRVLLHRAADDVESGGPTWPLLRGLEGAYDSMLSLRFLGAVHRLALSGAAPDVARWLPTCDGELDADRAWDAIRGLVAARGDELRPLVARPVQTNEPGRAAALVGGLHLAAAGRPVRLLELGASAGLLLRLDRYAYDVAGVQWGDARSPVRFDDAVFAGAERPRLDPQLAIVERRGCDRAPLAPTDPDDRMSLRAFVWADDPARLCRLDAALDVAGRAPSVVVDRADAVTWADAQLIVTPSDVATVVMHSVVMQYLPPEDVARLESRIVEAGAAATEFAPFGWLRFEPEDGRFVVRLTTWPGGDDRVLATAHPHGTRVRWGHQA